jgi:hypothetical protein
MCYTTTLACIMVAAVTLIGEPAEAQISHQGQDISDHVTLRNGSLSDRGPALCPSTASFKDKALFRVFPDGTMASDPFMVPSGRQLVITDVEWNVDRLASGYPLVAGFTVRTRVAIGNATTVNTVFLSRTVQVGSERGAVSGNEQLTTGFVVAPNTAMCPTSASFGSNVVQSARIVELVLRGYLITTN